MTSCSQEDPQIVALAKGVMGLEEEEEVEDRDSGKGSSREGENRGEKRPAEKVEEALGRGKRRRVVTEGMK
jgi:hypothetical protein